MRHEDAFTIVEVIVVMAIILVLAGLILATSSYVHKKGARSRAEAEIAAMSAALENYKADNGIYPSGDADVDGPSGLNAKTDTDPTTTKYISTSLFLYRSLIGDTDPNNYDGQPGPGKAYMTFKNNQLGQLDPTTKNPTSSTYIQDPFGYSYGYSTINQTDSAKGYNPTFDLWSTAGTTGANATDTAQWVKNW